MSCLCQLSYMLIETSDKKSMWLRSVFMILMLLSLSVWAMRPEDLCNKDLIMEMTPSQRADYEDICSYAGQYQDSLVPDTNATFSKTIHDGDANRYNYDEFFKSFTKSLNNINRAETCDKNSKTSRVPYPSVNIKGTAAGTIPISVVKEDELNKIFSDLANDPKFAFDAVENGCWARAHIMAHELEKRGIRVGKIFAEGLLSVSTPKAMDGVGVNWSYHVAPVIAVETKNGTELQVIDPSLFNGPVPVKTWTDKMLPHQALQKKVELYMTDRFVMKPLHGESLKSIQDDPSRGRCTSLKLLWRS